MNPVDAARQLLQNYWDGSIPVNPIAIAGRMGVYVYPLAANDGHSGLYKVEAGVPRLFVNQCENAMRRRFTVAHELGHHVLGPLRKALDERGNGELPRDSNTTYSFANSVPEEVAANKFAAELLMPASSVAYYVDATSLNLRELARAFNVSEAAMSNRLKNLGYF